MNLLVSEKYNNKMLEERQVVGRESLDRGQSLGQIQPTVCFVNEVLLEHSQAHLFMYHLWLFIIMQNWMVATERVLGIKAKIFITWPFTVKACKPLS